MKRPLCVATVFYILGIIMGLYLKMSIAFFVVFLISVTYILYIIFQNKESDLKSNLQNSFDCNKENKIERNLEYSLEEELITDLQTDLQGKEKDDLKKICSYILKFILLILILIIGIINVKQIDSKYEKFYKFIQEQDKIQIEAIVLSSVEEKDYSYTYKIKTLKINGSEKYKGIKLILKLRKSKQKENVILEYGDYITAKGEFEIPDTARNYGGFDYREYLKTQKIYGTIYVKEDIKILDREKSSILGKIVYEIQNSIKNNLGEILPKETSDLCVGILIGIRDDLSDEVEKNFKDSNLTHMLAVSGSHITYIILALTVLLSKADKRFSKITTILFLIFFMLLTGCTVSVVRACIMGIIMLISKLKYRKPDIWTNLALSTIIILSLNPYMILDIGFHLSYGGTIGIVLLSKRISEFIKEKVNMKVSIENKEVNTKINIVNKIINYIIDTLVVTLSANIIIIPIMVFHFNTVSLTFWISNLLASPFMGVVVILGFFAYLVSLISISISEVIAIPLNIILVLFLKIAEVSSKIPFSSIIVKTPHVISIVIYYFVIFLILNRKVIRDYIGKLWYKVLKIKNKKRIIKCTICFTVIFSLVLGIFIHNTNQKLKIYFIDVGQGDSTLIITPSNKKILIDGGGSEFGNFDVGEKTLLPYLLDRRIIILDYVMISHFDTDHVRAGCYI